ncbi:MAG TPA: hypothetical protein VIK05_10660 [Ilumatobacteraceae bacterium]|jgi:hypothetical protein
MPAEDDELEQEAELDDENSLPGLRKAAKEGKKALSEVAILRRENLFLKAGIDTSTKLGTMLFKTFEGEDLEALKAEATEIGALKAPDATPAPDPARLLEEQQRQGLYDGLGSGQPSGQEAPETEHPVQKALKGYQTAIRAGADEDAARADAMGQVVGAGVKGDKRVFFDAAAHYAAAEEQNRLAVSRPRG